MQDHRQVPSYKIEPLPDATRSKIRSTQILTSLSQLVSELVQNALDARATHIEIGVDCEDWGCSVRDNGIGIARDGMEAIAKTADNMSKRYSKQDFGITSHKSVLHD